MQTGGGERCQTGVVHGERQGAHLFASGFRRVSQTPGRRATHRLHQAETAGHYPGGVQRGAGPGSSGARGHPARGEPVQTYLQAGL